MFQTLEEEQHERPVKNMTEIFLKLAKFKVVSAKEMERSSKLPYYI